MKRIFTVVLSVLMLTLLLAACSGDTLVGTWRMDDDGWYDGWYNDLIFSSDMNYWNIIYDIAGTIIYMEEGTYSISDNEITLQVEQLQDTFVFLIDGNTLNIGGAMFTQLNSNQTPPEMPEPTPTPEPVQTPESQENVDAPDIITGSIEMEDGGVITFELYHDIAPQSVRNFVYLARQGFYDGLRFHRIMSGFMVQGGCPDGNGMGNPGYSIFGEFADNGFENNLSHTRGVMSMARGGHDYNSAGSQFFICHGDPTGLDGGYAAFGLVTSGMDVVDRIAETPSGENGAVAPELMPVIKVITIDGDFELPAPEKLPR